MKTNNNITVTKAGAGGPASVCASALRLAVALALISPLAAPRARAECFDPPVGAIDLQVPLDGVSPSITQNGRTLIRQVLSNPERIRFTVDRPSPLADVVFERTRPNGATQFSVSAAFVGAHGLVFHVQSGNVVDANFSALFFNLAANNATETTLFDQRRSVTDAALVFFRQNTEGSCLFVDMQSNRSGELQHNVFVMTVFRMDSGAALGTHASQLSDRGDLFSASILDPPVGSDTVRIRRDRQLFEDIDTTCSLPVPNLTVTPQPRNFGAIAIGATLERDLTLSNVGNEPVEISAIGSSAHFAPVNVTFPFTVQAGGTRTVAIRFTPGGASGSFTETLPITRCPGLGATEVVCTGNALPAVSITAPDTTASEPGTNTGRFTVTRSGSTAADLIVNLQIGGTATSGTSVSTVCGGPDYQRLPTSITIPRGSDRFDLSVAPFDDTYDEATESVTLNIAAGAGYVAGTQSQASVNISDNDPPPVMTIVGRSFPEGIFGSTRFVADVTLSEPSERQITVDWAAFTSVLLPTRIFGFFLKSSATGSTISCGTIGHGDFVTTDGQLIFPPCTVTQTISVPVCGDFSAELPETFFIGLSAPVNATLGITSPNAIHRPGDATCTILNDDFEFTATGSFELTPGDSAVRVNERLNYAFTWTVPEPLNWHDLRDLQLRIREQNDRDDVHGGGEHGRRAEHGRGHDKNDADPVLRLKFDEISSTFSVFNEAAGRFGPTAAAGSNKRLETHSATLHMAETSVVGSGPTGPSVTLNLSLSFKPRAVGRTYLVEVAASDDFGNQDAFAPAGTLTVAPWKQTTDRPGHGYDHIPNEINATGVTNSNDIGMLANVAGDNAAPPPATLPTLTIKDTAILEGNSTGVFTSLTKNFAFAVELSASSPEAITGFYSAVPASGRRNPAQPEDDFFPVRNVFFSIPPNTPSATLNVLIRSDNMIEPDEDIEVTLTDVAGAQVLDGSAIGTIRNDDGPPKIIVFDASATEPSPPFDQGMNFLVRLSHPNYTADTQVQYATRNDTALASSGGISRDYDGAQGTLTIPPNSEGGLITGVRVRSDFVQENTERFFVDLSNPVNATIADGRAIGTILQSTPATGDFALSLPGGRVAVDEVQPFTVTWTVPEGKVWRDLESIDFRLRHGQGPAFWVRWDEASNTFTLIDDAGNPGRHHGKGRKSDDRPSSGEPVGDPATPGSDAVLETRQARLHLDATSVQGSGPTGQSVTLNLAVSFPKNSHGHAYAIELAATGDAGDEDAFVSAGTVFLEPRR